MTAATPAGPPPGPSTPDTPAPLASVVIPVRNGAATLPAQLESLARQRTARSFEVVVADNGSTDGTADVVRSFEGRVPGLRLVDASGRAGANHARNVGTAAARGTQVLMCDADDETDEDWVEVMSAALDTADAVAGRVDRTRLNADVAALGLRVDGMSGLSTQHDFLPWPIGANAGYRRAAWEQVGGFDEDYVRGGTETEFFWRLQLAGFTLVDVPGSLVHYRMRPDVQKSVKQMYIWGRQAPMLYRDFRRHGMPWKPVRSLRYWLWVLSLAPRSVRDRTRRIELRRHAAYLAGRVVGSIKYRVLYL
ncbi:glycosyltransferase [Cellulomonas marina]|uniref:Glycosyltransferase involved in cell wall bisynthesis n=1 Tax=Cellulomonas marina TaxID=988821 RepID=A0A1I0YDM3_9CELL|nr:glycosyltransferase [Cellulomonas marina]GIG28749.1 glycosyl transferase [Cellulomonas marina]SFB11489.1 Glycosyltransferase involved in cell wall bisynthesis [Cellulomonas marina]